VAACGNRGERADRESSTQRGRGRGTIEGSMQTKLDRTAIQRKSGGKKRRRRRMSGRD